MSEMYKTEKEIFSQYDALKKTYAHILGMKKQIMAFAEKTAGGITFTGCGSSYSLCKSAAASARMRLPGRMNAMAAGDLLINFPRYANAIKDIVLAAPSRSGSTSEVVRAVRKARETLGLKCVSICAREGSELSRIADLNIELSWAFDESVCQTRTVTNLYLANLLLIALLADDRRLVEELGRAIEVGDEYMKAHAPVLKRQAESLAWEKVVVLADGELEGIAEEGALAFNEICRLPSNYYHILDVRHGPMVIINSKTLVIMACSPLDSSYQRDLISDLKARGAYVITVSTESAGAWGSDCNITIPVFENDGVAGIPFIFVPQALSCFKALALGINPDEPQGLSPWIELRGENETCTHCRK